MTNPNLPAGWGKSSASTPWAQNKAADTSPSPDPVKEAEETAAEESRIAPSEEPAVSAETKKPDIAAEAEKSIRKATEVAQSQPDKQKKHKKTKGSTVALSILLIISIATAGVYAYLYYRKPDDSLLNAPAATADEAPTAGEAPAAAATEPGSATQAVDAEPSSETVPPTDNSTESNHFDEHSVYILNATEIYQEPSYNSEIIDRITYFTDYVITEEFVDKRNIQWGKLKDRDGWINLYAATNNSYFYMTPESFDPRTNPTLVSKTIGNLTVCYPHMFPEGSQANDYYRKINDVEITQLSDTTYKLHMTGGIYNEYDNSYGYSVYYLYCLEMDKDGYLLSTYVFNDSVENDLQFDYSTTYPLKNSNTSYLYFGIDSYWLEKKD